MYGQRVHGHEFEYFKIPADYYVKKLMLTCLFLGRLSNVVTLPLSYFLGNLYTK